jgi:hypothetical protein
MEDKIRIGHALRNDINEIGVFIYVWIPMVESAAPRWHYAPTPSGHSPLS